MLALGLSGIGAGALSPDLVQFARGDEAKQGAEQGPSSDAVAEHQATLEQVDARLSALRERIADRVSYRKTLLAELRRFERDIDDLARANRQLSAMVLAQQDAVDANFAKLAAAREDLVRARAAVAELVRAAHALGRADILRFLLHQDDPLGTGRAFGYYRVLADARAKRLTQVAELHDRLRALDHERREELGRLARIASRQSDTRLRLTEVRSARASLLSELEATIATEEEQVTSLAADAAALRRLIDELARMAEIEDEVSVSQAEIADLRGQLAWPLSASKLISGFGEGRAQGALHADGVLLAAELGAEVRAVHHGRVVYADWLRGFGMLLVIDHGAGYMTLYGHNQALLKDVGEWVASGELIALAGESGGAGRRGLYFAIRRDGRALDPTRWCGADAANRSG